MHYGSNIALSIWKEKWTGLVRIASSISQQNLHRNFMNTLNAVGRELDGHHDPTLDRIQHIQKVSLQVLLSNDDE